MLAPVPTLSYRTAVRLDPGLNAVVRLAVGEPDTARAMGTGSVPVLATPRLIALCEEATCRALAGALPEGCTSVAGRIQFDHLTPVRTGSVVTAEATLERVEGRRLVFTVSAIDAVGLVGAGRITRVVVRELPFLDKAR
jgi:fluoroacetyl-CoA thioesterase